MSKLSAQRRRETLLGKFNLAVLLFHSTLLQGGLQMEKMLCNHLLSSTLFWANAMILDTGFPTNADELSTRVKKLVDESVAKKAIAESSLLNENPLQPRDVPGALGYINKHTDYTSYHLL